MNQLHKDEADIVLLQQRFNQRGDYTEKLTELTTNVDASAFTEQQKKVLNELFQRFAKQEEQIQEALDYILEASKEQLNHAINSNKADKSYQLLNE